MTTNSTPNNLTSHKNALPGPDDIVREVLPNGLIVLVRENFAVPSVVINGSLHVGSIYEDPAKAGLSAFVSSALMRGTRNRDFDTLHEALESIGASLGVGSGVHTSSFGGRSLSEDLPVLLDILADALRHPAFPVDQTERLRGEILTGLKIRSQDTRAVANDAFRKLTYPVGHPYRHNLQGEVGIISKLTLDELAAFHAQHYGPREMILIIVGAVKAQDAIQRVRDAFGDWRNDAQPTNPTLPPIPPAAGIRQEFAVVPGKTQSDIILGWPGPSRFTPEFQAANLANNILGVFGMMGRLGQTVREDQGLAYYASSRIGGGLGPSPWNVSAGVNPANVRKAIESMVVQVRRITEEMVSEDDLADNKANFIGRLPLTLESNDGVAGSILSMETYGLGLDYLRRYPDIINAVTRTDVQLVAQKYLHPDAYALAVAGPDIDK